MPATSIFISAASAGTSGIAYSRISVLLGPVRTAASTFSATVMSPLVIAAGLLHPGPPRRNFAGDRAYIVIESHVRRRNRAAAVACRDRCVRRARGRAQVG